MTLVRESDHPIIETTMAQGTVTLTVTPSRAPPAAELEQSLADLCETLATADSISVPTPQQTDMRSLTGESELAILEFLRDVPLPDGWIYDGAFYISFDGRRTKRRPDADQVLAMWPSHNARRCDDVARLMAKW
jgi:hypothetical protein